MNHLLEAAYLFFRTQFQNREIWHLAAVTFPFMFIIELPFGLLLFISILRLFFVETFEKKANFPYYPFVSCIVTCYNEGEAITQTLKSLVEQLYRGNLEILVIIDDASINKNTLVAAQVFIENYHNTSKRYIRIIPKYSRGGHASSLNLGLRLAKGEVVVILDGDCSCDNTMIAAAAYNFLDLDVVGVSGTLRVRNRRKNILTRLQAIEYMLSIHLSRIGLSRLGTLNVISSAFGAFRKSFLQRVGGWKNGSAEDLDLTLRIEAYFKRLPQVKLIHDHQAIAYTDVPETWWKLFKQRFRWDGDLYYMYFRRHWYILRPKYLGWRRFTILFWSGFLLHIIMPFLLLFYLIYILIIYSLFYVIMLMLMIYIFYIFVDTGLFFTYLLLVSERKRYDLKLIPFLLLMPSYRIIMRVWSVVAIIFEIVLQTHKNTTMAPWWVIRKTD